MTWAKQSIDPKDYFRLATHQLPNRGCPIADWELLATETFYKQGLVAAAYIHAAKKSLLITFHLIGKDNYQEETIELAKDFSAKTKEQVKGQDYKITYTGYQFGGSLAEHCAINDKLQAYTFDSQPIFTASPRKNNYFNLIRYTSNPKPDVLYGNTYYVDIYKALDADLLDRWQQGLQYVEAAEAATES